MNNPNPTDIFLAVLLIMAVGASGFTFGYLAGHDDAQRKTTVVCVTKPQDCKVRYQYYQLEASQK